MLNMKKLSWEAIKNSYPATWVKLTDVDYDNKHSVIKYAKVIQVGDSLDQLNQMSVNKGMITNTAYDAFWFNSLNGRPQAGIGSIKFRESSAVADIFCDFFVKNGITYADWNCSFTRILTYDVNNATKECIANLRFLHLKAIELGNLNINTSEEAAIVLNTIYQLHTAKLSLGDALNVLHTIHENLLNVVPV